MSSTSWSCVESPSRRTARTRSSRSSLADGHVVRSPQYHAGIWWPHHSWREMHQSWMFPIQWKYVFAQPRARTRCVPSAHRLDRRLRQRLDLHEPLPREQRLDDRVAAGSATPTECVWSFTSRAARALSGRSSTFLRASKRSRPANVRRPSRSCAPSRR